MYMKEALRKKAKGKKGFTLVELVIVIAVLAIIAAIAIPTVSNVINNANVTADKSNAQSIELAIKTAQSEVAANATHSSTKAETLINAKTGKIELLLTTYGVDPTTVGLGNDTDTTDKLKEGTSYHYFYNTTTGKVYSATAKTATDDIQLTKGTTVWTIKDTTLTVTAS